MKNRVTRELAALPAEHAAAAERDLLAEARASLAHQSAALLSLAERVDESFARAVELIASTPGHTIFLGIGKSGIVAQKLAATFASTGTPSFFVHCAEAHHGDLGMITERDTVIILSRSGETREAVDLLPHLAQVGVPIIAMVGCAGSPLERSAHVTLDCSVDRETCPNNLAPTTSTLAAMAMGDALAVALMKRRNFQAHDFARFHPGGSLGRPLTTRIKDAMRTRDLPKVSPHDTVGESLVIISEGRLGMVMVMQGERLAGLVTDGDLRRAMQRHENLLSMPVSEIMTLNPVTIDENELLGTAEERMRKMKLKALVAVDSRGRPTGVIEVFGDR